MSCIKLKKKSSIKWWILTICLSGFGIKNTKNSAINCDMRSTPTRILQEWSLPTWHCDKRHSGDIWIMKIGDATFWYSAYRHFDTGIFEKPMRVRARGRLYQDGGNVGFSLRLLSMFAEKDRLGWLLQLLLCCCFGFRLRLSALSERYIGVSCVQILIEYSCVLFSRR